MELDPLTAQAYYSLRLRHHPENIVRFDDGRTLGLRALSPIDVDMDATVVKHRAKGVPIIHIPHTDVHPSICNLL